jgi:hypothetical protein
MRVAVRTVEVRDARVAGGLMLAAAAIRPVLPGSPGLPCPLRTLTGIPCPLCGMTTSVTDTLHGHVGNALAANPGGIALVILAVVLLVRRDINGVRVPSWLLPAVLSVMWAFELFRFSIV